MHRFEVYIDERCLCQNGVHPRDFGTGSASETCNALAVMKRVIETQ